MASHRTGIVESKAQRAILVPRLHSGFRSNFAKGDLTSIVNATFCDLRRNSNVRAVQADLLFRKIGEREVRVLPRSAGGILELLLQAIRYMLLAVSAASAPHSG